MAFLYYRDTKELSVYQISKTTQFLVQRIHLSSGIKNRSKFQEAVAQLKSMSNIQFPTVGKVCKDEISDALVLALANALNDSPRSKEIPTGQTRL